MHTMQASLDSRLSKGAPHSTNTVLMLLYSRQPARLKLARETNLHTVSRIVTKGSFA
jgi:hypothetical protein